jgi:hypothetical protein
VLLLAYDNEGEFANEMTTISKWISKLKREGLSVDNDEKYKLNPLSVGS